MARERTLCLRLTTEVAKETEVAAGTRAAIVAAVQRLDLTAVIDWVHVQRHPTTGLHFSIAASGAAAAAERCRATLVGAPFS
jgi:hypothetical protein